MDLILFFFLVCIISFSVLMYISREINKIRQKRNQKEKIQKRKEFSFKFPEPNSSTSYQDYLRKKYHESELYQQYQRKRKGINKDKNKFNPVAHIAPTPNTSSLLDTTFTIVENMKLFGSNFAKISPVRKETKKGPNLMFQAGDLLEPDSICLICLKDSKKMSICVPCGHSCICLSCAPKLVCKSEFGKDYKRKPSEDFVCVCPLCKSLISNLIDYYTD